MKGDENGVQIVIILEYKRNIKIIRHIDKKSLKVKNLVSILDISIPSV
jgi:hypothetical protein